MTVNALRFQTLALLLGISSAQTQTKSVQELKLKPKPKTKKPFSASLMQKKPVTNSFADSCVEKDLSLKDPELLLKDWN